MKILEHWNPPRQVGRTLLHLIAKLSETQKILVGDIRNPFAREAEITKGQQRTYKNVSDVLNAQRL